MALKMVSYEEGVEEPLFDFYRHMYPSRDLNAYRRTWEWVYFSNPDEPNPDEAIILALDGDQIVGHLGTIAMPYKLGDDVVLARLGCDLMVKPDYRDRGIGVFLIREWTQRCELALAMGVNVGARPLYRRLGWHVIPLEGTGIKMLSARYYVARMTANAGLTAASHVLTRPFFRVADARRGHLAAATRLFLEPWDEFPEQVDQLLEARITRSSMTQLRTRHRLNWRFARSPACDYKILGVHHGESLVGYVVIGLVSMPQDRRSGRIFDWVLSEPTPELRTALWSACLHELDGMGADHMRISIYPGEDTAWLRKAGFLLKEPLGVHARQSPAAARPGRLGSSGGYPRR